MEGRATEHEIDKQTDAENASTVLNTVILPFGLMSGVATVSCHNPCLYRSLGSICA